MATVLQTDPLVFARDACNDLEIPLRIARGLEAVAILVRSAVMLWRDEWFLDRDAGMPWLETEDGAVAEADAILGQKFDVAKCQRAVRGVVLKVTAVKSISAFRAAFDGGERALSLSFTVHTNFGDQPIDIVLPVTT